MKQLYRWDNKNNRLLFWDRDALMLWKKPSLLSILKPLIQELGEPFYFLLIAYEACEGIEEDYNDIIKNIDNDFEKGLIGWGKVIKSAGWGSIENLTINWASQSARLMIKNPWELDIYQTLEVNYNMPFMCGKLSGLFSKAFGNNARAKVTEVIYEENDKIAKIEVKLSNSTLKSELDDLNEKNGFTRYEKLQFMNKSLIELSKELEEKNKLLEKLASTDSLTGIYNRRFFVELAQKELYEIKRYNKTDTLLILDVDNFKQINDEYGHMYGDKALKVFSKVCSREIRGGDIFGRIGGEEFAIILTNTSINNATIFAERLRNLISKIEIEVQNKKFSLTVSIGITNILTNESIYKAMSMADKALYEAKGKGRNRVEILER